MTKTIGNMLIISVDIWGIFVYTFDVQVSDFKSDVRTFSNHAKISTRLWCLQKYFAIIDHMTMTILVWKSQPR